MFKVLAKMLLRSLSMAWVAPELSRRFPTHRSRVTTPLRSTKWDLPVVRVESSPAALCKDHIL